MPRIHNLPGAYGYLPVIPTLAMVGWTSLVYKTTAYEDVWASSPVVFLFLATIILHIVITCKSGWNQKHIGYALLHIPASFVVGIYCLMLISKDSL
jgi:hypothetical protein